MGKPLPKITAETRPYWDACQEGRLIYQRCGRCGLAQFPPASLCVHCHAREIAWEESAGRGQVHAVTAVRRPPFEAFKADVPYALALIDLAEGFRIMTQVRGADPDEVRIGDPVEIVFEAGEDGFKLPQARWAAAVEA